MKFPLFIQINVLSFRIFFSLQVAASFYLLQEIFFGCNKSPEILLLEKIKEVKK